jgi:hypothetical protein
MADQPVAHVGENSPEEVAFKLFHELAKYDQPANAKRDWFLDLYAECLQTVRSPSVRLKKAEKPHD